MKKFLFTFCGFLIPIFLVYSAALTLYFYWDPFMVLRNYNSYGNAIVGLNRDFISTEIYLRNEKKIKYNSFILGSSRAAMGFKPSKWHFYLNKQAVVFSFDASTETIYGILQKLNFIEKTGSKLENVLIILCEDATFNHKEADTRIMFQKHPKTSNNSWLLFHLRFISAYLNPMLITSIIDFKINHEFRNYMIGYLDLLKTNINKLTNETTYIDLEDQLSKNPDYYYETKKQVFFVRDYPLQNHFNKINDEEKKALLEIIKVLQRNGSHFKVVISPLYSQRKFSSNDMYFLKNIFKNNLYDFSGKNYFTNDYKNYYENSHFRPHVGDSIMNLIYSKNNSAYRNFK